MRGKAKRGFCTHNQHNPTFVRFAMQDGKAKGGEGETLVSQTSVWTMLHTLYYYEAVPVLACSACSLLVNDERLVEGEACDDSAHLGRLHHRLREGRRDEDLESDGDCLCARRGEQGRERAITAGGRFFRI